MVRPFFRTSWTDTTSAKPMMQSMAKKAHSASARSGSLSSPSIAFILLRGYHPLSVSKHSPELETKHFMPVFSDLCCLCHDQPVQKLIAHNVSFIHQFSEVCQLFMCVHRINARRRATWNMKRTPGSACSASHCCPCLASSKCTAKPLHGLRRPSSSALSRRCPGDPSHVHVANDKLDKESF